MRILYIDIDSLRPDHLSCYGYSRPTSPTIDRLAAEGVRFDNVHISDAPCLPSRTALFSGRFGIHTGVINHGGTASQPFLEGPGRGHRDTFGTQGWMSLMRRAGLKTVTISPFGERHSAWHWYAGFREIHNTGKNGMETADEVAPIATDWLTRYGHEDNWFLHVNLWDPHTLYRTPLDFGEPFKDEPLPGWLTEAVRQQHWQGGGPHSAQEMLGLDLDNSAEQRYPRQPVQASSMAEVRRMFDGYDTGVRYADEHIGHIVNVLADLTIFDETAIIVSADHGENLGELNIYGDHQTADQLTTRVPLIVRWPGVSTPRVESGLHYQVDVAATVLELLGVSVPELWDGAGFAAAFRANQPAGREFLVVSQGAWCCQRAVRWGDHLCIRTYRDAYHDFPEVMLFDVARDPHEQHDLAADQPGRVGEAMTLLGDWTTQMMRRASHGHDPMWTVLHEGGSIYTRGKLPQYLVRLRETGRAEIAERLAERYPDEAPG